MKLALRSGLSKENVINCDMKPILTLLLGLFCSTLYGQTEKLRISHLTGDFYIYTTWNSFNGTPFPSNSMYVVTDSGVVLIDTPWDVTQTLPLLDSIERRHHQRVVICVVTHFHDDRTAGLSILRERGVRTYSTNQTLLLTKADSGKEAEFFFHHDTTFRVGDVSFRAFYPGPGHAPDNIVVWFPKARVLYGGCLVKSIDAEGLGNLGNANTTEWPQTIRRVMKMFPHPKFIIPGHQGWLSTRSLQHTLDLLKASAAKK